MKYIQVSTSILAIGFALATNSVAASKKTDDKFGKFVASVELGYIMTSGNTESTSIIVKTDIGNETESFRNQFSFDSLFKEDEIEIVKNGEKRTIKKTSKEQYAASAQTNYKVNDEGDAILAFASYETNRFSAFHYQASIATGYNTRVLDSSTGFLDLSLGPGYSFDSLIVKVNEQNQQVDGSGNVITDNNGNPITGDEENRNQLIWRAAATYQRKITDQIKFKSAYSIEDGDFNRKSEFEASITMQVNGSLAVKASVKNKKNSSSGVLSNDKQNRITLVYNF
ncbi:hypothetical protein DS2_02248 [Catenovulum agarivorans DS-2]|uniref:DUF481 domain-containing protein n=1 Tax=Catenovulum agarivorans DS-2 TaxID=1328313 RepID=W7QSG2_9ALTE|nr:DUF481 domain-containing protein [Catenovulum agarivorans]EWH11967.1 hypothetical protein DS2_02248 [Catenovulum agarivorans DS-2]